MAGTTATAAMAWVAREMVAWATLVEMMKGTATATVMKEAAFGAMGAASVMN